MKSSTITFESRAAGLHAIAVGVGPALLAGSALMIAHNSPPLMPATNAAAAAIGVLFFVLTGVRLSRWIRNRCLCTAVLMLLFQLATFAAAGFQGVHRWISPCGLQLHPAAIGTPVLLLAIAALWRQKRAPTAVLLASCGLAINAVQPDAGQATALGAGVIALALHNRLRLRENLAMILVAFCGVFCAWLRPDPLPPADMVENIIPSAFALHPAAGVLAIAALAMLPAAGLWHSRDRAQPSGAQSARCLAMAAYLLASIAVVAFGEFPTPVLGFGASPVVGAILGLGLAVEKSSG